MKFTKILLLIVATFFVTYSAAPAAWTAQDASPSWGFDGTLTASSGAGLDTLVGTDSTTLWRDLSPKRGYAYSIVRDAITGTGSDSVNLQVRVDCKDKKQGSVLYSVVIDTMTASTGEAIAIPFGSTLKGNYFDVKLVGLAGAGSQVIINRVYMDQTRGIQYLKMWR